MSHYTITVASNPGTVFAHTGGTLEVVISDESVFRASAEIKIQYETAPSSGVYKTLPTTSLISPQVAPYLLSACNVKAVLIGGDASASIDVRLVSVA